MYSGHAFPICISATLHIRYATRTSSMHGWCISDMNVGYTYLQSISEMQYANANQASTSSSLASAGSPQAGGSSKIYVAARPDWAEPGRMIHCRRLGRTRSLCWVQKLTNLVLLDRVFTNINVFLHLAASFVENPIFDSLVSYCHAFFFRTLFLGNFSLHS